MDANGRADNGSLGTTIAVVIAALLGIVVVAFLVILIALSQVPCGKLGGGCGPGTIDSAALRARVEQDLAHARETCEVIPASTADQIVAGIGPIIPGAWEGQPGREFPIEEAWLTAYAWPPSSHIVKLNAVISTGNMVTIVLLLEGSLDAPSSIKFLTNSSSGTNPTSFERELRDSWPYEPLWHCGEVGAVSGPYLADQLGLDFEP